MTHLDTSFLVRALIPGTAEEAKLRKRVGEGEALVMSSVAWAEFLCGPLDVGDLRLAERFVERRQDFTPDQAVVAARLFNESGRRRGTFIDCMIAAAALVDGAAIATSNVADFSRFAAAGLKGGVEVAPPRSRSSLLQETGACTSTQDDTGRVAARGLHPDGRRLSARQRRDALRAGFASVATCAPGLDDGCTGRTRQVGIGLRLRRLAAGLQRVDLARPHGERVERAAAIPPGRVHPTGRARRDRLRSAYASGDTQTARPTRAARACARMIEGCSCISMTIRCSPSRIIKEDRLGLDIIYIQAKRWESTVGRPEV